uniref:ATP synthase complex subunit 8 n=1 Tax=Ophidiaster granifer TaxID=2696483 RepID=A0A7S8CUJ6_9ECHI|nr:ATP synthase F0 subunit 8 [Ophidiaster granifer]QPC56386.1 ATP synthase F0 subunit 8 [Ophidiaster granifer]
MPQLNLAWWLFNFTIGWISIIFIITIFLNKNILPRTININESQNKENSIIPNTNWLWN